MGSDTPPNNGEEEYEYEYDQNETEDCYFTFDVSTHASGQSHQDIDHESRPAPPTDQLQILDLQSDNPLIKLNDALYSCTWSTDLGTQVYLTRPGVAANPKRRGDVLDVVALSRARLIGRPAKLRHRQAGQNASAELAGSSAAYAIAIDEVDPVTAEDVLDEAQSGGPSIDRQITRFAAVREKSKDPAQKAQASFLERLSDIKRRRGETDLVPFYGVKRYDTPENKDEIRENALVEGFLRGVSHGKSTITKTRKKPGPKPKKRQVSTADPAIEKNHPRSQPGAAVVGATASEASNISSDVEDNTNDVSAIDPLLRDNTSAKVAVDGIATTIGSTDPI